MLGVHPQELDFLTMQSRSVMENNLVLLSLYDYFKIISQHVNLMSII